MRQATKLVATALGAALLLTGCGETPQRAPDEAASSSGYDNQIALDSDFDPDGHFNWGYAAFASHWDPIKSSSGGDGNFWEPVYDRLLAAAPDGEVVPMLATEFTAAADGKTLTLTLREGLTFSDGEPFNAEAVKFNLDRNRGQGSRIAGDLHQVTSVEVVDEYTVDIKLSGAIGALPMALTNRAGIMVSPAAAEAGLLDTQAVGIGPYLLTGFTPGVKAEYERSPDYWEPEVQRVATMTYHYMPDDQTRINALKSGQIDGANIRTTEAGSLEDGGFVPLIQASGQNIFILLNPTFEPFDDPQVRKAVNMAIDREAISQGLYDGYCTPQIQPFAESGPGYSKKIGDGLDLFPYDPEAAKELMAEAGVQGPVEITTLTPNVTIYTKLAEVLQQQLAEVDIQISIDSVPPPEVVQQFALDQSVESMVSISTGINDPDVVNSRTVGPDALYNPGGTVYEELVKWGDEGAASIDPAERAPAYEKYMDAWVEEPPHLVPICMVHAASAFDSRVSGVEQAVSGGPNLRGVAVAKQ